MPCNGLFISFVCQPKASIRMSHGSGLFSRLRSSGLLARSPFGPLILLVTCLTAVVPHHAQADNPFPYDTDTGTEVGLLLTSAAAYGLGWWLDSDFRPLISEEVDALDPMSINFLDRPATEHWSPGQERASDILVNGQLVLPLVLPFSSQGSQQPAKVTVMYLETMALNTGLTYLLKNTFNRSRPLVYNDHSDVSLDLKTSRTARKSFPSGHTANAFASMVFLAGVYEQLNPDSSSTTVVWGACLASATITGVLRVTSGRHFTTDVLAGAALGSLIGWMVPRMHEIDGLGGDSAAKQGISLSYGFVF